MDAFATLVIRPANRTVLALILLPPLAHGSSARADIASSATGTQVDRAAQHASHAMSIETLPVVVDGAKEPERIPTDLAYRHFIRAIVIPEHEATSEAITEATERRRAHISRIGLAAADETALSAALSGVGDALARIRQPPDRAPTDAFGVEQEPGALRTQERDILESAGNRVRSTVSSDGAARLDAYVQKHIKTRIIIYGALPE